MRSNLSWLALCAFGWMLFGSSLAKAADLPVRVVCPCVEKFIGDYRNRPLSLMVIGKLQARESGTPKISGDRDNREWNLIIEEVLFGSPPHKKVLPLSDVDDVAEDAEHVSKVYRVTSRLKHGQLVYEVVHEAESILDLPAAKVLARLHLDYLVLGCEGVFIGAPTSAPPIADATMNDIHNADQRMPRREVRIERVLHGTQWQAGDRIVIREDFRHLVPIPADNAAIYLVLRSVPAENGVRTHLVARWSTTDVETVTAALKRRATYPVVVQTDRHGNTHNIQEIRFQGSRKELIALLGSRSPFAEFHAAQQLKQLGPAAIPDIVAVIESNLWREELESPNEFGFQRNLIQMLGSLEGYRIDGEVGRLIESILTKAEAGANYPAPLEPISKTNLDRDLLAIDGARYRIHDRHSNHSLAWLCMTLTDSDAAQRFGSRMLKLRDLTQYGWRNDAQALIDEGHWVDHLGLAELAKEKKAPKRLRHWQAGFEAPVCQDRKLVFSPDGKWLASSGETTSVWSTRDWSHSGTNQPVGDWLAAVQQEAADTLPFETVDSVWRSKEGCIWTLEESADRKKPARNTEDEPRPASDVCLRQARKPYQVQVKLPLEIAANCILVSADGNTVVATDRVNAVAFTAPDWKMVSAWSMERSYDRFTYQEFGEGDIEEIALSPDGRWLAYGLVEDVPQIFDVTSGKRVSLGFPHDGRIVSLAFSKDGQEILTKGLEGKLCRWQATTGKLLERRDLIPADDSAARIYDPRIAGDTAGNMWYFERASRPGDYFRPRAYKVEVVTPGKEQGSGRQLGEIELKWQQHEPIGLAADKYLYVGTNIFDRQDLKPISAVNVCGEIQQVAFNQDGRFYGLITFQPRLILDDLGGSIVKAENVVPSWRIHDTLTGRTRFASSAPAAPQRLAISPGGDRVAIVTKRQQLEVWSLPER